MGYSTMKKATYILTGQYSFLQFGYWVDYLLISSFAAVLLMSRGFEASEIGYVTTAGSIMAIFLQTYLSALADKSKRITLKQILGLMMATAFLSAAITWLIPDSHMVTFIGMFTAFGMTSSISPLLTALCLRYNYSGYGVDFGIARSLGSCGYAASGFVMGRITERFGADVILPIFCVVYVLMMFVLLSMRKADKSNVPEKENEKPSGIMEFFMKYPRYDMFLISVMMIYFMQMILGTYMIYFVRSYGGGEAEMGTVLSVAAFSEMPAVAFGMYLLKKFSSEKLLRVTAIAAIIKFVSMVFITDVRIFIGLQLIHFFYSGMYMVSSVYYANSIVDETDSVKAQGILAVGITGVVGIAANIIGGYMLQYVSVKSVTILGAIIAVIGMFTMFLATGERIPKVSRKYLCGDNR